MAKTYHTVIKNYVLLNKVWKCTQGIIFIIKMVLYKNILVADWEYGTKKKKMPLLEFLLGLLRECTDYQRRLGGYAAGVKI